MFSNAAGPRRRASRAAGWVECSRHSGGQAASVVFSIETEAGGRARCRPASLVRIAKESGKPYYLPLLAAKEDRLFITGISGQLGSFPESPPDIVSLVCIRTEGNGYAQLPCLL